MTVVTDTPLTLAFAIPNVTEVLTTFNRLAWFRSRTGVDGLYEPATAPAAAPAVLTATAAEPHQLNGKSMTLRLHGTTDVTVTFAGADPYSSAAAAVDLTSGSLTATVDADGRVVLTTVLTGSAASIEIVSGEAAPFLGFDIGAAAVGLDQHLLLVGGTYQYFYTDSNSDPEFYYRVQYYNSTTLEVSELSLPITGDLSQVVPYSNTVVGYVRLADPFGRALSGRKVTIATSFVPGVVAGHVMARHYIDRATDRTGYAEFRLVKGAVVDISIDGTGIIRRITVPSTPDVFDFFDPALNADDEFGIATLSVPFAIRTT